MSWGKCYYLSMGNGEDFRELNQEIGSLIMDFLGNKDFLRIILIAGIVLAFLLLCFIIFIIVKSVTNAKNRKMQHMQFKQTLDFMHSIHRDSKTSTSLTDTSTDASVLNNSLFESLVSECEKLGDRIDHHTDRENNSKKVSELVYKVSLTLGLEARIAQLYFCIALVYDAGFLDFPEDLFRVEILSSKEKSDLKTHVFRGITYYTFVPKQVKETFALAAMLHHENINGTGYPEGLRSETIPLIARIIHTVESYVSLTNPRRYHASRSPESAIAELKTQPGIYDSNIVEALEKVL